MDLYNLKTKFSITKDFLTDLEDKGWQEIEMLQNQIANIDATEENVKIIQLLKNLLTNYYVFVGGLENLINEPIIKSSDELNKALENTLPIVELENTKNELRKAQIDKPKVQTVGENTLFEPFEYFVDFDEPSGDPISDEDLYSS